jgi:CHAT domain-containing protein
LRINGDVISRQRPLIIGNPDYDADFSMTPAAPMVVNRSLDFPKVDFSPLPGTEAEVIALRSLLTEASILTGRDAAKSAVKAAASPSILHIATHGFFLPDQEPMPGLRRSAPQLFSDRLPGRLAPRLSNPLLRSGLALAGANKRDLAISDNGILTALEMASLDLWGTQLVVLSACETGLGDTRIGDGVYGLRRALVIAGTETQIMSLWEVDDAATRDLMVDYYVRLINGEGRGEALRNVQLQMCGSGLRNHPFYWAAFIQSGNWRRLNLDCETTNATANS